jgi:hypothetical protein
MLSQICVRLFAIEKKCILRQGILRQKFIFTIFLLSVEKVTPNVFADSDNH